MLDWLGQILQLAQVSVDQAEQGVGEGSRSVVWQQGAVFSWRGEGRMGGGKSADSVGEGFSYLSPAAGTVPYKGFVNVH